MEIKVAPKSFYGSSPFLQSCCQLSSWTTRVLNWHTLTAAHQFLEACTPPSLPSMALCTPVVRLPNDLASVCLPNFSPAIFKKVSAICCAKGVRFVAINRRGYSGSTPFGDLDKLVLTNGTSEAKTEWLRARGFEIATFIDTFIQRENLPPVSAEGNRGGAALLGWSAGTLFTAATIAHVPALPPPVQARLASYLRVHILEGDLRLSYLLFLSLLTLCPRARLHYVRPPHACPDIFS